MASNWSTDTVPGPNDDVVIAVTGATPTVTIGSNVESVHSITSSDPLAISGGGLTVAANSTISGGLNMTGGTLTATGSDVALSVTGTTTISGASVFAESGATLNLTALTSYSNAAATTTLEATGTNSVLNLANLASVTESSNGYQAQPQFEALAGGTVTLVGVADDQHRHGGPGSRRQRQRLECAGAHDVHGGQRLDVLDATSLEQRDSQRR